MAEAEAIPLPRPRRFHFEWILPMFWKPRSTLAKVISTEGSWLTPLLVLSVLAIIPVLIAAPIRKAEAQMQPVEYPPDYQYWTPEQQADYERGATASSSPTFIYFLPILKELGEIWVGWLLIGAILHLTLTILGSRGSMGVVLNVAAWASVPIILRYLVQSLALLTSKQLVTMPGLAGFAPTAEGNLAIFLTALLALIDLYVIWQAVLLITGMQMVSHLGVGKVTAAVVFSLLIVLALQALPGYVGAKMGGLSIIRPFFF